MTDNVVHMSEFLIQRHVKNFVLAYRDKGKREAGYILKDVPETIKNEVAARIRKELSI